MGAPWVCSYVVSCVQNCSRFLPTVYLCKFSRRATQQISLFGTKTMGICRSKRTRKTITNGYMTDYLSYREGLSHSRHKSKSRTITFELKALPPLSTRSFNYSHQKRTKSSTIGPRSKYHISLCVEGKFCISICAVGNPVTGF